ncbi:hypothetical protein A1O3_04327 [Capronia epimyces CBS 606.96]|uniref:DUF1740-domain-containing protein n=1 Tax=Capronia epimyces CBS 606.96 TaxID=1182542 RepID=W9Y4F9_9EURO|nr:uncharacterized protein A1O3_04327 [Capronia epimyces CBS 606.96]EXJ87368.1 hypothetical protein A1O3_04327 [Capronia epimyces CBS 606.96]
MPQLTAPISGPTQRPSKTHKPDPAIHRDHESSLFVVDRKGDRQNLAYGSPDRYAIPRYRVSGSGALLGLGPKYRITSRTETRYEVENVELDSTRKVRRQSLLSSVVTEDPAPLKALPVADNQEDLGKSFLRFEHGYSRKRRRITRQRDQQVSDTDGDDSISDLETDGEMEDAFETFKSDPVHQRHVELSRATVEHPQDPKVWLAFIDYQQTSFSRENDSRSFGLSSGRSLIDIKISLYRQALSHIKGDEERQPLILGLMHEGSKIWDSEKQASEWRTFLNKDASFDLWILYLNFMQSNQVRFTFENCLEVYKDCLQIFRAVAPGRKRDSNCIYLLLRCTLFLWQSGFTERAVGIWQALFEYCFFRPQLPVSEDPLESFHRFWASEVARIGEEGATGWNSITSPELGPNTDRQDSRMPGLDFATWAAAEDDQERCSGLPARTLDEVSETDPYRVLLFSDVREFLFSPSTSEGLRAFQDAFLLFVGLPVLSSLPESRRWQGDPFVFNHSRCTEKWTLSIAPQDLDGEPSMPLNGLSSSRTVAELYFDFLRRFLFQLATRGRDGEPDELLAEYAIALEAQADLKTARRKAKALLKQRPNSLSLYNTYAVLEYRTGNLEAAERVWSTAISMRGSLGQDVESSAFPLWREWAYSYLLKKRFNDAEVLLSMLPDSQIDLSKLQKSTSVRTPQSISTQIKAEVYIKTQFEANLSKPDTQMLPAVIDVLVIYKYLTQGLDLEAALEVYESCLNALVGRWASDAPVVETVHEHRAYLLHSHATTFSRPYKPGDYCLILRESVRIFPDNLRLLMLQQHYAQKSGLFDRLRQVDARAPGQEQVDRGSSSIIPCMFDLLTEVRRPSYAGSTDHSIRSAFRRATDQGAEGYHCMAVWKAYVMWELSVVPREKPVAKESRPASESKRRHELQKLADVFYSSLRACPWSKELYMLAFSEEILRDGLSHEGLERVYESMQDRGLRLRIELPESH